MADRKDLSKNTLVRVAYDTQHGYAGKLGKILDPDVGNNEARVLVWKIGELREDGSTKTTIVNYTYGQLEIVAGQEFSSTEPAPGARPIDFNSAVAYVQASEGAISEVEMVTVNDTVASTGKPFRCKVDLTPLSHLFCRRINGSGNAQWYLEYGPAVK